MIDRASSTRWFALLRGHRRKLPLKPMTIALLSGVVMALSLEPLSIWPLAWIGLVPLWVLIVGREPRNSFCFSVLTIGAAWGMGYYGVLQFWITGLHPLTWMGIPWLASLAIALFCWTFITVLATVWLSLWVVALRGAVVLNHRILHHLAHLSSKAQRPSHFAQLWKSTRRVLIGVALWCGVDLLWRQTFLYWSSLALTQSPHNLLILHLGQWAGPNAVAAAIVAVNGFLAEAWLWWRHANCGDHVTINRLSQAEIFRATQHISSQTARTCGAIALTLVVGLHGLGALRFVSDLSSEPMLPTTPEEASSDSPQALHRPLRVGIVQGNVPTRIKLSEEGLRRAFQGYTQGYETLVNQGADAVLTPEGAFPIIWSRSVSSRTPLYQSVRDRQIPVWIGTFFPEEGNNFTQSLITLNGDGDITSRYNKVKLVPLGEYIPFESVIGAVVDRLSPLDAYMIPGSPQQTFSTPFGKAIVGICYESAFPQLFRRQAQAGGEFILTASNNDPYSTAMMAQHHAQDVLRAIETDRWAARATNTGYSGVVDHHGRTLWRSRPLVYQTYQTVIDRRRTITPYVRWGDWLTPLLLLGAMASLAGSLLWAIATKPIQKHPSND